MIDPTQGVQRSAISEPSTSIPPRTHGRPDREAHAADQPETTVAERPKPVPSKEPVLDVRLDGETMRLYTELRDPETDRVLIRLPAAYQGDEPNSAKPPETSFEA